MDEYTVIGSVKKTIIVDIDNTILKSENSNYLAAVPMPERIKAINRLYSIGHTIIYWTARGATSGLDWTEVTKAQLKEFGCLHTELRMGKPSYDVWIDDKAINAHVFFGALKD